MPLHHVNSVYMKLNFRLVDRTPRSDRYCCSDFGLRTWRCFVVPEQCALSQDVYISDISDRSSSIQRAAFSCQSVIKQNAIRNKYALFLVAIYAMRFDSLAALSTCKLLLLLPYGNPRLPTVCDCVYLLYSTYSCSIIELSSRRSAAF